MPPSPSLRTSSKRPEMSEGSRSLVTEHGHDRDARCQIETPRRLAGPLIESRAMENGVDRGPSRAAGVHRAWAKDAYGAIALAEGAGAGRVFLSLHDTPALAERNAFGGPVAVG